MQIFDKFRHKNIDVTSYKPDVYRLTDSRSAEALERLLASSNDLVLIDELDAQLRELIKSLHPSKKIPQDAYPSLIRAHLNGQDPASYGVWVYYPWNNKLIHLLDENEFVEVRTNRNRYKITREEQALLKSKKIGIIGLSVGQSIALTIAQERACGELRLADFDTAELSNLNRIRTGVHNLGLKKTVIAAREIAEIDPFMRVRIFNEGITNANIDAFFGEGAEQLDLLVEVCDGLDIKINSRFKARELGIPVVMDTNDRGLLDVERFDLEPDRPILHGLAEGLNPENIRDLSNEDKIPYILKMVNAEHISTRLKASMMEVEQSINTWPQLASSVTLGGAITTDVSRRILLGQFHDSGRYYIDLEELVADATTSAASATPVTSAAPDLPIAEAGEAQENPYAPLSVAEMQAIASAYLNQLSSGQRTTFELSESHLQQLVDAVIAAPSAGNNQPWKLWYEQGRLFLFHDKIRSHSWGDYYEMGAHMSLGAALENIHLQALALNLADRVTSLPLQNEPRLIAVISFDPANGPANAEMIRLSKGIYTRSTNRRNASRHPLPAGVLSELEELARDFEGFRILHVSDSDDLSLLGGVIAACDRIRLLQKAGHSEFYSEIRWNQEHAAQTRDGIELAAVDATEGEKAGFRVASDWNAVQLLAEWDKGQAFTKTSIKSVNAASAMVLITAPAFTHPHLLEAGRLVERAWIHLTNRGVSVHPMLSPTFFFNRLIHGKGAAIPDSTQEELRRLRSTFTRVFPLQEEECEVFLMKLAIAEPMSAQSLRLPKEAIFFQPDVKG